MPCYRPLEAWRSPDRTASGKLGVTFNRSNAYADMPLALPCGQCIGCRLERSRQWAVRCVHESRLHEDNCFITLTYDDDNLPIDGGLRKEHFQKFIKRLRSRFPDRKLSYFHCGEYGEQLRRPHYHAILFGFDFQDKKPIKNIGDSSLFCSDTLNSLWQFGFATIGACTFESAAYVARYCLKKVKNGKSASVDGAPSYYSGVDRSTGEIVPIQPEYVTMSLKRPIAKGFYEKFSGDVFPHDYIVLRGKRMRPPKYYEILFERNHGEKHLQLLKYRRIKNSLIHKEDNTYQRLLVKEKVVTAKTNLFLNRHLER